jgi:hypothetical protein
LQAGGNRDDWVSLAKAVNTGAANGGNVTGARTAEGPDWRDLERETDITLVQAREDRRAAAGELLRSVSNVPGRHDGDGSDEAGWDTLRQNLQSALMIEDAAIDGRAAQESGTRAASLATLQARLRWLAFKRRIAAGGAGAGLVPEWESNREGIDALLSNTWDEWLTLQSGSEDAVPARHATGEYPGLPAHAARQAITAAFWGLYPDAPMADLVPAAQTTRPFGRLHLTIVKSGTKPVLGWSD